jgi:hypothetical protein
MILAYLNAIELTSQHLTYTNIQKQAGQSYDKSKSFTTNRPEGSDISAKSPQVGFIANSEEQAQKQVD